MQNNKRVRDANLSMMPAMSGSMVSHNNTVNPETGPAPKNLYSQAQGNTAFNSMVSHKILDSLRGKFEPFDAELYPVLEKIRKMVEIGKEYNGWVTMILLKGVDNTNNDLSNVLNNISIVSGLLMTVTLTGALAPPANIAAYDNTYWAKQAYMACIILSSVGFISSILLNTIFLLNLSTTARLSDMLKLYLTLGRVPLITIILFSVGAQALF